LELRMGREAGALTIQVRTGRGTAASIVSIASFQYLRLAIA
jgi:hypothetical protein